MRRWKFAALVAFMILSLIVVGCGPTPVPTKAPEAAATEAPAPTEAPSEPAEGAECLASCSVKVVVETSLDA